MTIELVLRDHLNRTAQERFKVPRQRKTLSKQVIASIEIHQKIDIAIGSLGAASHRPENANSSSAIFDTELVNRGFVCADLVDKHGMDGEVDIESTRRDTIDDQCLGGNTNLSCQTQEDCNRATS